MLSLVSLYMNSFHRTQVFGEISILEFFISILDFLQDSQNLKILEIFLDFSMTANNIE